jgi:outer membrane protein assembly factor BamB
MTFRSFSHLVGVVACLAAGSLTAAAQKPTMDWPQWRGPNRDGSAPSFTPPKVWPENLTQRWKAEVGIGYATPVVVGNRVYTFARRGDDEVVAALDAASGKQIWQAQYPAPYVVVKAAAGHGLGPKATPAFADGRLFTHGISGILSAFDAASGKLLWQKPAPAAGPTFTTSQSPIVDRGLLIVHVGGNKEGGLTAFDPATGNQRWTWSGDGPGYGSPIVAEIAGTRQVITPTYQNLVGVSAETGELLWRRAHRARSDVNAITPLVVGDTVISSGVEIGIVAVRVSRQGNQWTTQDTWLNPDVYFQLSNGTIVGDALFGLSSVGSGTYVIVDTKTGKPLWSGEPRAAGNAAIQKAGNTLFILENDGELIVADATKTSALTPIKRYKVSDTPTWAAPAISGNRIFVKDESTVTLWTVD